MLMPFMEGNSGKQVSLEKKGAFQLKLRIEAIF
jgi:hypothetical protein